VKLIDVFFVQMMNTNQLDHIAEILMAPGRELELYEFWEGDHPLSADRLRNSRGIRKRDRARFSASRKPPGDQDVKGRVGRRVQEPPGPSLHPLELGADEGLNESIEPLGR